MSDLEQSFARLLDRQPTDKERQRLYRTRDALNLKATDAVWQLLMVLEHYETLYEKIPARIDEAARTATNTVRATAEAQAKAAQEEIKRALTDTVNQVVDTTAKRRARAEMFKWVSVAASTVAILLLAVGWGENRMGRTAGLAAGENRAKRECSYATMVSSWALTPDGIRAYELEKAGSVHDLVNCSGRGLERKGDWCFAPGERGKPYRWRLPAGDR